MSDPATPNSRFSSGRRWLSTFNLVIASAAVLAIVVMANYLAQGWFKRFQWAFATDTRLSDRTLSVLHSLTNDVTVTMYFDFAAQRDVDALTADLLAEYQNANPRHIRVERLDYVRSPGAQVFLDNLHLAGAKQKDFIAFQCGSNHVKLCYSSELSDFNINDVVSGRPIRRTAFLGEERFTSDIWAVAHPGEGRAYFLTGHGERDPEDATSRSGVSKLAAVLKNEIDCAWQRLSLVGTNLVPADCRLLVIATPRDDTGAARLESNELARIKDWLNNSNGRLLALLDTTEGLDPVLADFGVRLGDDLVVDLDKRAQISGVAPTEFLASMAKEPDRPIHTIVEPLATGRMFVHMVAPRPIYGSTNPSRGLGAASVTPLFATSPEGVEARTNPPPRIGSFPLAAAIEKGVINGRDGTRIVLAGDADFLDNQLIDSAANHYFAERALNWLLDRPNAVLTGLAPKATKDYELTMTDAQVTQLRWLFLAGLPGAALFLGCLVWLRRRS